MAQIQRQRDTKAKRELAALAQVPYIIVVMGKASTGKTVLCQYLQDILEFDYADSSAVRTALGCDPSGSIRLDSSTVVYTAIKNTITLHTVNKKPLIVESTGHDWRIADALKSVPVKNRFVIELIAPIALREEREQTRTDRPPVSNLMMSEPLHRERPPADLRCDTSKMSSDVILDKILVKFPELANKLETKINSFVDEVVYNMTGKHKLQGEA